MRGIRNWTRFWRAASRRALRQQGEPRGQLGIPVPGLAYPFGYSNAMVRQVARAAGYGYGYAVRNRMADPASDPFMLPRLTVHHSTSFAEFQRLVREWSLTTLRDRALTAAWSVVRRSRTALSSPVSLMKFPDPAGKLTAPLATVGCSRLYVAPHVGH